MLFSDILTVVLIFALVIFIVTFGIGFFVLAGIAQIWEDSEAE